MDTHQRQWGCAYVNHLKDVFNIPYSTIGISSS